MWFFQKKDLEKGFVAYEEIDSKKTSKLGYFFLVLMVLFGVWQGQNLLEAIQQTVAQPLQNSACAGNLKRYLVAPGIDDHNFYYGDYNYQSYQSSYNYDTFTTYDKCAFSDREKIVGLSRLYEKVYPSLLMVKNLKKDLDDINQQNESAKYNRSSTVNEYSVSLLETIARKNQVLNMNSLRGSIKNSDDLISSLTTTGNDLQEKINTLENEIRSEILRYKAFFERIEDEYSQDRNIYDLKKFGLSLLFILPVFLFVWRKYWRSKNEGSEYAIIWSGVLAISAIMLAQVLLVFIYEILPRELLQKIFDFLKNFKFFWSLLYWLGFILIPAFFGGLIYFIQKKFYNKKAVAARAFKAGKCPTCSMSVAPHMIFCPVCAATLKIKCSSCGNYSPEIGNFCEICGVKKSI
ncbi:zinc ribbon domain-containing protein [Candidatus Azambacteria bacterium]|nr:zinc ribbon domain-containing protein [Candidatus Azambacteria bacterium]